MILYKITHGFVSQTFDTKKQKFVEQRFTAGDDVFYENEVGGTIDPEDEKETKAVLNAYQPFDMVQPEDTSEKYPNTFRRATLEEYPSKPDPSEEQAEGRKSRSQVAVDIHALLLKQQERLDEYLENGGEDTNYLDGVIQGLSMAIAAFSD